ncbi:MAG: hypothetical protein ACMG6S_04175 [Byssovorax sp.]
MGITLSTRPFSDLFWMLFTVYAAINWAFRIYCYQKDLRYVRRHAEISLEGPAAPGFNTSRIATPWVPTQNLLTALMCLQLIPCLWGPVCLFVLGLALLSAPAAGGLFGLCLLSSAMVTAWFCRGARNSLPDLERDVGVKWRRSAAGALITGGLLLATIGIAQLTSKDLGALDILFSYGVAVATLLLGAVLRSTTHEVVSAEKNLRP